ncbi:polysaccharide deacetylase family protein [Paradesulfitobacterium aromaticivorans]
MLTWEAPFFLALGSAAVYTVVPDFFLHKLGVGSWKRQYGPGVSLTFDDGPDPDFTPKILDLLEKYQIKAAFFLVGEKALKHPELVHQIQARGHKIGAHCQHHRHGWLMHPAATVREWKQGVRTLEELTGQPIEWVRPPWGIFNLVFLFWFKHHQYKAILWNAEGHDWLAHRTPEEIAARVLSKSREGSIVLLHDSGGEPGAPANSLMALDLICKRLLHEHNLPLIPLEFPQWKRRQLLLFTLWEKWEQLYSRLFHVQRIGLSIFRLSKSRYQGPELCDENGHVLARAGDTLAEIHFDSLRLQNKEADAQKIALNAMRQARESLPLLARYVAQNPDFQDVKVLFGQTLIHRGVKGFGFNVHDLPHSRSSRRIGRLQQLIMQVYHPNGKARLNSRLGSEPKLVWISKEKLLKLWLPKQD